MAIESPRPAPRLGGDGYDEGAPLQSAVQREAPAVKLRLRAPFVEDAPEAMPDAFDCRFNAASRLHGQKRVLTQASELEVLVEACRRSGNFEAMTQAAEELAACCREMDPKQPSREARALRLCTRGQLMLRRPKRAIQSAGRAMTLFKELGDSNAADEMRMLFVRAQTLREGMQAAAQDARQAWLLYREHGDPRLLFQAAKNCHDAHHKFDDQNVLLLEKL